MARIKIKDLQRDTKISREEMKKVLGGFSESISSLEEGTPQGVSPGHVYTVLGTTSGGYVVQRNPWGTAEADSGGTADSTKLELEKTPISK